MSAFLVRDLVQAPGSWKLQRVPGIPSCWVAMGYVPRLQFRCRARWTPLSFSSPPFVDLSLEGGTLTRRSTHLSFFPLCDPARGGDPSISPAPVPGRFPFVYNSSLLFFLNHFFFSVGGWKLANRCPLEFDGLNHGRYLSRSEGFVLTACVCPLCIAFSPTAHSRFPHRCIVSKATISWMAPFPPPSLLASRQRDGPGVAHSACFVSDCNSSYDSGGPFVSPSPLITFGNFRGPASPVSQRGVPLFLRSDALPALPDVEILFSSFFFA